MTVPGMPLKHNVQFPTISKCKAAQGPGDVYIFIYICTHIHTLKKVLVSEFHYLQLHFPV